LPNKSAPLYWLSFLPRPIRDYAEAGIPEYWIVNPLDETISLLTLQGDSYVEHGIFQRGERATSLILNGFSVTTAEVFDAK
jgi:Uma2 family endonuclease